MVERKKQSWTKKAWVVTTDYDLDIRDDADICFDRRAPFKWVRETPQPRWSRATVTIALDTPPQPRRKAKRKP